jgi:hypothetical protein
MTTVKILQKHADFSLLLLSILFFYFFSPFVNNFTAFWTPDSEFYLSLSNFGNEVTERAPWPAYFWTKTSLIAPVYLLTRLFPYEYAFLFFQLILLIPVFIFSRSIPKLIGRKDAVTPILLAVIIVFNSVLQWHRGNIYATGTAHSVLLLLLYLQLRILLSHGERRKRYFFLLGFFAAVLLFLNPIYFALAFVVGISQLICLVWLQKELSIFKSWHLLFIAMGMVVGGFLLDTASQLIFPNTDWYGTVTFYSRILNASDYSSGQGLIILLKDPSFYPILSLTTIALMVFFQKSTSKGLKLLASGQLSSFVFYITVTLVTRGVMLEAPFYSALLWSYSVPFFAVTILEKLDFSFLKQKSFFNLFFILVLACLYVSAGSLQMSSMSAFATFLLGSFFLLLTLVIFFNQKLNLDYLYPRLAVATLTTSLVVLLQLLQNSPSTYVGSVVKYPYSSAFGRDASKSLSEDYLNVQSWLLQNTNSKDRIMVWAENGENLVGFAAMQLWGPNSFSQSSTLSEWERVNLINSSPNKLVFYYRNAGSLAQIINSFPANMFLAAPLCKEYESAATKSFTICIYSFSQKSV